MKQITYDELAEFLFANKGHDTEISFCEKADNGEESWYCAATTVFADAPAVMINYCGGGQLFMRDISDDDNAFELKVCLRTYFRNFGIDFNIWVDEMEFIEVDRRWVSVEERLPECYHSVMVRGVSFGKSDGIPAHWDGETWWLDTGAAPIVLVSVAQWRLP